MRRPLALIAALLVLPPAAGAVTASSPADGAVMAISAPGAFSWVPSTPGGPVQLIFSTSPQVVVRTAEQGTATNGMLTEAPALRNLLDLNGAPQGIDDSSPSTWTPPAGVMYAGTAWWQVCERVRVVGTDGDSTSRDECTTPRQVTFTGSAPPRLQVGYNPPVTRPRPKGAPAAVYHRRPRIDFTAVGNCYEGCRVALEFLRGKKVVARSVPVPAPTHGPGRLSGGSLGLGSAAYDWQGQWSLVPSSRQMGRVDQVRLTLTSLGLPQVFTGPCRLVISMQAGGRRCYVATGCRRVFRPQVKRDCAEWPLTRAAERAPALRR